MIITNPLSTSIFSQRAFLNSKFVQEKSINHGVHRHCIRFSVAQKCSAFFLYNRFMSNRPARKTYFGVAALFIGIFSALSSGANYGVSFLNITPAQFNQLNSATALLYCFFTPLAAALGILGLILKNDSKTLSGIALVIAAIPFLMNFIPLILALVKYN